MWDLPMIRIFVCLVYKHTKILIMGKSHTWSIIICCIKKKYIKKCTFTFAFVLFIVAHLRPNLQASKPKLSNFFLSYTSMGLWGVVVVGGGGGGVVVLSMLTSVTLLQSENVWTFNKFTWLSYRLMDLHLSHMFTHCIWIADIYF